MTMKYNSFQFKFIVFTIYNNNNNNYLYRYLDNLKKYKSNQINIYRKSKVFKIVIVLKLLLKWEINTFD